MGEAALKRMTVDEFLVWDGEGDTRYELIRGEIVAMTPPSSYHGVIAIKAGAAIGRKLAPRCNVISEAGIRLPWRNDTYYQADLAITCSKLVPRQWAVPDPLVIIEVLSPTTEAEDRGVKLVDYRHIDSVQAILLVASEIKRVEFWRRRENAWTVVELEAGDSVTLDMLGFDIPVEALYDGLDFTEGAVA
jgi:Uma2 family endonuclease